jgi:hypothetical protein
MTTSMTRREAELTPQADVETQVRNPESGKIGWVILWLLGIPLPILLIVYLIWGR